MILRSVRARVVLLFGLLLLAALRFAGQGLDAADRKDLERYQAGIAFLRALTNRSEALFPESEQRQAQDLLMQLLHATNYWGQAGDSSSGVAKQARRDSADAMARLATLFDKSSQVERLWIRPGEPSQSTSCARTWPYGSGALLLRIGRQDLPPDTVPLFLRAQQDLSTRSEVSIDIGTAQTAYAIVMLANAPSGEDTCRFTGDL